MPIHISGTGSFLPQNKVNNSSFSNRVFFDKDGNRYPNSNDEIIEKFNKPVLVGVHLLKNGKLPSGETINELFVKYKSSNWIGVISSCVSMEIAENSIDDFKTLNVPFGFKVNLWGDDEPSPNPKINKAKFSKWTQRNLVNLVN